MRATTRGAAGALLLAAATLAATHPGTTERDVTTVKKITPVLYVEAIEPVLPFWEKLGFERTAEVPEGDRLGFLILSKDGLEVMYQTRASVAADIPALADTPMGGALLFIEVASVDAVEEALAGVEHVIPRRTTFYGADELVVREPAGNLVTFAEFKATGG